MLEIIRHDSIHELRLARAPVNALNSELLQRLSEAIRAAPGQGARALIVSGSPGMFSAGMDVPALLSMDRMELTAAWRDFFALCGALACSPIPSVAAITGHSPAGGAIISIFCDYRVMARGAFKIGLNEVQVGLGVPECIQIALRRLIGTYRAERLMIAGTMLSAEEAHTIGFVDELVEPEQVVTRARTWLEGLLRLPPIAMSTTRRIARADLIEAFADLTALPIDELVDSWYGEETQKVLKALVAKLKSNKG